MAEIVEVVEAGNGWTTVRDAEGNVFKLEGARNWRNNNPGNIEYGDFAKSLGAVGTDGRFAVFPSYEAGRQAKEQLIFSSPRYQNLTLEQAISRYAPPNENNTSAYLNQVVRGSGIPASTLMSQIPASARPGILNTMERVEGFKVGRTYNAQGIPLPPAEIPNAVASALSVTQPRVAPTPASQSPDLAQMRNPIMSSSARYAQVTPSPDVPLPRPRPSAPDIVTPTMSALKAQDGNTNARRAVDMLASSQNPYTPRLTADGVSDPSPQLEAPAIVGGIASLTPGPARQRLPDIPRTIPGQSQIERVASNVKPAAPAVTPVAPPAQNMRSRDSVANAALGQRVATQIAPAFNPPAYVPPRLTPKPIVQPTNVTRNQPPIQIVPAPAPLMSRNSALLPMAASSRPSPMAIAPVAQQQRQVLPIMSAAPPLKVVVQRDPQPSQPSPGTWAPQGYTNDGSGRITSNETGGQYYERHLRR